MQLTKNALCPCGSGKKYKHCCRGKTTFNSDWTVDSLRNALRELSQGNFISAEYLLRGVRGAEPGNPDACNLLGVVCAQSQRQGEAIELLTRAVQLRPKNAQYRLNLGLACYADNRLEEACMHFSHASKLDNSCGEAYENLGYMWMELGDMAAALRSLEEAHLLLPETPLRLNNLAIVYAANGLPDKALKCYDRALCIGGDSHDLLLNKAKLALACCNYGLAREVLAQACAARHQEPSLLFLLAEAHEGLGEYAAARMALMQSESLGFYKALVELRLGQICTVTGEFSQAIYHFETALALDPELTGALAALTQVIRADHPTALADKMEHVLRGREVPVEIQIKLNFALGKHHDDAQLFDIAFEKFMQGNNLRHARDYSAYDIGSFRDEVSRVIEFLSADFLRSFSAFGSQSNRPIIIYGMPRSGTTLTEQILASNSQVHAAGELSFFQDLGIRLAAETCQDNWPTCLSQFDKRQLSELAREYLDHLSQINGDVARITNKMPHNFMSVGLIYLLFPKAQFIHCTRNPLDNCLSIYFQNFAGNHPYAYDMKLLGQYYAEYQRLVDHWKTVLPAPILEMKYENTVADAESITRKLLSFCHLPWEEGCLEFYKTKRAVKTASVWQARQKIYTGSVDRWRNYENHLGPLIEALGPLVE